MIAVMSCGGGLAPKAASISYVCPPATVSSQVLPEHPPLKPEKVYPEEADVDSVRSVPSLKLAVQVPGQSIPAGTLVTVPFPDTVIVTCAGEIATKVADMEESATS